jgi:hypothetical protein
MTESTEEESLFESYSIYEAVAYKMLIRKPEEKRSFYGRKNKYVNKRGISFDHERSEPAGYSEMIKNWNTVPVIPKHSIEASISATLPLNKESGVN